MQPRDTQPGASSPPRPGLAQLAALPQALARAGDDRGLLAAAADLFAPRPPARIDLLLLHRDEHGAPQRLELAATWPGSPLDPTTSAASEALQRRWLVAPDTVLHLPDLADPRDHADVPDAPAITLLPLHRPDLPVNAGLRLHWPGPAPRPAPDLLRLLATSLALARERRHTERLRDHALATARSLQTALAELHAAPDLDVLLAVLAAHAARHGATAAWLLRCDDTGPQLVARHGAIATPPTLIAPTAQPTTPLFFPDLAPDPLAPDPTHLAPDHDPTADPHAPIRAAALLPLGNGGRADGHVILAWPAPHTFGPDEREQYLVLAHQAAVVVANHRLLAAAQDALHEQQRQRATLAAILDHLPVGVVVQPTQDGQPLLLNRRAEQLRRDLVDSPLLYPDSDTPMPPDLWPITRARRDEQVVVGEAELRAADGTRRALESVAAPVHDEHGALTHIISVTTEVTAWRAAEAERLAMQDALIRAQEAALTERSTPLLPIADDILVLPIVGGIDEQRGQQITETLVHLGGSQRVRVAILDVTGAGALDERGAHLLVGAARALRLRGARPILTGLGPDAAASLAAAGVDLAGVTVLGSLQAGIALARALTRRRPR